MSKYKDMLCANIKNCTVCPFAPFFKECMKIGLDEKLGLAFERIKSDLDPKTISKLEVTLEKETKIK